MRRPSLVAFLVLLCAAASPADVLNPRGARPVVPNTRSDKCATQKEWPFCTDDDWGPKCPSGCRIQGLMDHQDHSLLKKIEKIRALVGQQQVGHRSADQATKQTYEFLKEKLTLNSGQDDRYYNLAQNLRQRISEMKVRIDRQLRVLAALRDRVTDQVGDMQKLEVDIDIKLRSCRGSCKTYSEYRVDHDGYVALDKQINQLHAQGVQSIQSVHQLEVMQSRPFQEVHQGGIYKTHGVEDIFREVKSFQLTLEKEGSSSSPAPISKDQGTSISTSGSSTSSKSISELSGVPNEDLFGVGGNFEDAKLPGLDSTSCVIVTKKVTVMTQDGPVEKIEETREGGPACKGESGTKGGLDSLFPVLSHTSTNVKTVHVGASKGAQSDTKTAFSQPFTEVGFDLGKFLSDHVDDDIPDLRARSVQSVQVKRQSDYTGKDCVDIFHKHTRGETSGVFDIKPSGAAAVVAVYCLQEGLMGGWLLVQQRGDGLLDFNRTWAEYRAGFGSVDAQGRGEMWLGNQNLHLLTDRGETLLRVNMRDEEGGVTTADYVVRVGPEEEGFPLHVSGYAGTSGDALSHSGMKFSTWDRDNDRGVGNCAATHGGGWWYDNCRSANLNGGEGAVWAGRRLKSVQLFVRPAAL
ncbi:fibrinogen alpha chain-like isoform X1 [Syngnathoides biaculeatus]|uniref:fibrinogen alpha chain-like isoform X1 n=1 Tax=Syngnathoides biaculeatus TaxID=300417 RepID=UPI002ADD4624|nr:fibrinogen alpha chain-like isoform X1 [Syngnathoides biaculeatus]